jgi:hypothetical protein
MSAFELMVGSREGATDSSKDERRRLFRVDVGNPDSALFDAGLPALGTVYPTPPGHDPNPFFPLILDRYEVQQMGDGQNTVVTCIYTNDRRGRINPAPDRTKPAFTTWEITYQKTQIDFPSLLRYPLLVPGADVPATDTPTLDPKVHKITETLMVVNYSTVLQFVSRDQINAVQLQNNRIHRMPDNRIWLFTAGDIRQTEKAAWEVTYTWTRDTGTTLFPNYLGGEYQDFIDLGGGRELWSPTILSVDEWSRIDAGVLNDPTAVYLRSPFHVITYVVTSDLEPQFYNFLPYRYDANGWQSLPGFRP